jgi:hypothetical protein
MVGVVTTACAWREVKKEGNPRQTKDLPRQCLPLSDVLRSSPLDAPPSCLPSVVWVVAHPLRNGQELIKSLGGISPRMSNVSLLNGGGEALGDV